MKHQKKIIACSVVAIIAYVMTNFPHEIRTRQSGLELIGQAESCMREPYLCPAGVWTVGIGSTGNVLLNKIYSDKEIAERWVKDIRAAETCVNRWADGENLPQGAFEALTSLTFNVGCGALKYSTIYKYAKQQNIPAMCGQFSRWIYAKGKVLSGVVTRRDKEKALCLRDLKQPSN